ncbi:MAG: type II toxin-antitoxin system RelE/ParE family toxin [Clostridia bacterium]|nr:type II toxin-antitoxin system RelE/ParE family toxin [Clostridia bacterium]
MKYQVLRTDKADAMIRKIVLYIAERFGPEVAMKKLEELEDAVQQLGEHPLAGTDPRYPVLKRQGYKVLILEKDLVFYKIDESRKLITVHAVTDQQQDYLSIIRGL